MTLLGADASPDPTMPDVSWLATLPSHPIFESASPSAPRPPRRAMAIRNTDLLVATGGEIRMASLLEVKHHGSGEITSQKSSYKILTSSTLDFNVVSLLVNPTGKLLIAVGTHRVAVVVLPRPGTVSSVGSSIAVNAGLIGRYWHHESSGRMGAVADCKWHPWGFNGTSLMILTKDGQLREYDVSEDTEEPVQTLSLLPSSSTAKSSPVTSKYQRRRSTRSRSRSRSATPSASVMKRKGSHTLPRSVRAGSSRIGLDISDEEEDLEDIGNASLQTQRKWNGAGTDKSAVAFTFGLDTRSMGKKWNAQDDEGQSSTTSSSVPLDWNPLTVFGLRRDGDVYAICPFLPKRASIPSAYIHALSSYVSLTSSSSTTSSSSVLQRDLQLRFLSSILKQAQISRGQNAAKRQRSTSVEPQLSRRRRSVSATPMSIDPRASEPPEDEWDVEIEEDVLIEAPTAPIVPSLPQLQGPFLFTPEPHELSTERESNAADMFFARVVPSEQEEGQAVHVFGVVGDDGRLDLCVLLDSLSPKWPKGAKSTMKVHSSGRYALSDTDDEDSDLDMQSQAEQSLPSLLVYETVDLGVLEAVWGVGAATLDNIDAALTYSTAAFEPDPLYSDTIYVHHILGVHAVNFGKWARLLAAAVSSFDEEDRPTSFTTPTKSGSGQGPSALERFLHRGVPTDIACIVKTAPPSFENVSNTAIPVVGVAIVSDIYLSYSFLALTVHGRLVSLELDLRNEEEDDEDQAHEAANTTSLASSSQSWQQQRPPVYTSLLGDGPAFKVPEPFSQGSGLPSHPRSALGKAGGNGELRVTPETLRLLATTVEELRLEMRKLVRGGNVTQARLDLEVRELTRQLSKLVEANNRAGGEGTDSSIRQRMERVMERQRKLMKRTDGMLQKLMEKHHPQLSVYEEQWFQELDGLSREVGEQGGERGNRSGLTAKVEQLQHQLSLLKPDLEELKREQSDRSSIGQRSSATLGAKQLNAVERLLSSESNLLVEARNKVQELNHRISQEARADVLQ